MDKIKKLFLVNLTFVVMFFTAILSLNLLPFSYLPAYTAEKNLSVMPKLAPSFKDVRKKEPANNSYFQIRTALPNSITSSNSNKNVLLNDSILNTNTFDLNAAKKTVPPEIFRLWLNQSYPNLSLNLQNLAHDSIYQVKGVYDNSGRTLNSLGLNFKTISGADLAELSFNNTKVIILDCPGRIPDKSMKYLKSFVENGGFLLSTDWSGDNAIQKAFPGYFSSDGHKNKKAIYNASPSTPNSILMNRVVSKALWKMDYDSHMVSVLRPDVCVLARSSELALEDPKSEGVLALYFPYGRGYVMHLVGHFDNNSGLPALHKLVDAAPLIGISLRQALAANFIIAGVTGKKL